MKICVLIVARARKYVRGMRFMTPVEKRTILINASIEVKFINNIQSKNKTFNDIIKSKGINEVYYFIPEMNTWREL